MKLTHVILGVIFINMICIGGCTKYRFNDLVENRENVNEKTGNLQAQYQRRFDLTMEIIRVIRSENNVMQSVLTDVLAAQRMTIRIQSSDPNNIVRSEFLQKQLSTTLNKLLTDASGDSKLNFNQSYQDLLASIEGSENRINYYRTEYNRAVRCYNACLHQFPNNLYVSSMGFKEIGYYKADTLAANILDISFKD
jgi:LemA protein